MKDKTKRHKPDAGTPTPAPQAESLDQQPSGTTDTTDISDKETPDGPPETRPEESTAAATAAEPASTDSVREGPACVTPAAEASSPADAAPTDETRLQAMLAEAENRGYLRGRNESIEELMSRPGMLERNAAQRSADDADGGSEPMILSHCRVSIWDR